MKFCKVLLSTTAISLAFSTPCFAVSKYTLDYARYILSISEERIEQNQFTKEKYNQIKSYQEKVINSCFRSGSSEKKCDKSAKNLSNLMNSRFTGF